MARNYSKCPHMDNITLILSPSELCKIKQGFPCSACNTCGPNLWICLHRNCLHTGCSEQANDHSTEHFKLNNQHCIHMNLSSQRIWCYLCETEVFLTQRRSSLVNNNDSSDATGSRYSERIYEQRSVGGSSNSIGGNNGDTPETSGDEEDSSNDRRLMDGLVGLQNIANTCYMNAALQALSNSPPLTYYFLDCGDIIEATSEYTGNQRKPGLAKSYHRLIKDMWCRNKRSNGYVVPRGILYGIRSVHPMFRGYQQHDTQEFLRCFMDQLHEELKEVTPPPPEILLKNNNNMNSNDYYLHHMSSTEQSPCSTPSQSEAEYETCDSGVSEQSSLSDEAPLNTKRRNQIYSRSPSPQRNLHSSTAIQKSNSMKLSSSEYIVPSSSQTCNNQQQQQQQQQQKDKTPPKSPHRSIISDVFDGKLLSSVQCLTCDRVSTREETFQDLSLPIPGKDHLAVLHQSQGICVNQQQQQQQQQQPPSPPMGVNCTDVVYQAGQDGWFWWVWNWFRSWFWGPAVSLHDCMAAFFSADELKGDNMYSCEKCNKLRNGIKYSRVLALPEMLCVHLKRFRHDLSYSSKISSPVNFPLTGLDMRPYLHKECKSEISTYDLTAVICHHGTVGGGHYTSFAKHELTGKWFEFDDQLVTEVSPEVVQNCQAYVLFYRKINPQMAIIRAQAQELAELNPPQASDIRFFVSRQWINRFNTFAEPGPIDNWAILCPHGGLPPCKVALIPRLAVPLPQPLWDFLYKKFGGGPACNRLFECDTCRRAAESLSRRQESELEAFTKYNNEFQYQDPPTTIFAISMAWLRQWQLFARGVINEEPGPINNTIIAGTAADSQPIRNVLPGSDYAQLNPTLWKFFHGMYGGGPEIILRGGAPEDIKMQKEKDYEIDIDQDHQSITKKETNEKTDTDSGRSTIISTTSTTVTSPLTATATTHQLKTTKNVSFDDDPDEIILENSYDNIRRSSSGGSTKQQKKISNNDTISDEDYDENEVSAITITNSNLHHQQNPSSGSNGRRGKHSNSHHDIVSKKDRKYRSAMKSSGLFGPEGKYYTQKTDNNIPGSHSSITTANNTNNITTTTTILDQISKPSPSTSSIPINNFQITQNGMTPSIAAGTITPTTMTTVSQAKKRSAQQSDVIQPFRESIQQQPQVPTFQAPTSSIKTTMMPSTTITTTQNLEQTIQQTTTVELHPQQQKKNNKYKQLDSLEIMNHQESQNANANFNNIKNSPINSRKLNGNITTNNSHNSSKHLRKKYKSKNNRKSINSSSSYSPDHGSDNSC